MSIRKDKIQLSIEINGTKAGSTQRELINQARDLGREIRNLVPGTDAFIKKSQELKKVNNVLATIRNETKGVAQGVNSLTDFLKKGVVASLAFFSVQRVIQWGKELLSWATKGTAALEAMERKTAIVFGDATSIVEDFAAINAQALGVTEKAYAGLAATIGDILIPMGFQREEAAKMSTDLVNLSGALSEWSNGQRSAEEVSKILAKALTGERESLKELGIVIQEADVQARLLANGKNKLTGAALQQAKAEANLQLIMERSQDAQRSYALNQDSITRSSNRMAAAWNQVKEAFLQSIIPTFKSLGNTIADSIAPIKRQSDAVGALQAQFNVQIETLKKGNISQDNRRKLIEQINTKYKDYLPNLINEKTSLTEIRDIQDQVNQKFEQRILLLATEENLVDVGNRRIKLKAEELSLSQKITESEIAIENQRKKFNAGASEQTRTGVDNRLTDLQRNLFNLTAAFNENKKSQAETEAEFANVSAAAKELGIDLDDLFNKATGGGSGGGGGGNAKAALDRVTELINQERQLRIKALDYLVLSEQEHASRLEVINLESENKISTAKIKLAENTESEILKLKQDISDTEIKILETQKKLELDITIEQLNQEKQLRIKEAQEIYDDEADLADQIKLINLESDREVLAAKLTTYKTGTAAYYELQNDITQKDREIAQERINISQAATEEMINIERNLAIKVLDEMLLDEEDYQIARAKLDEEYNIRILEAKLKLVKKGTLEALELERQIRDARADQGASGFLIPGSVANAGGSSSQEDAPGGETYKQAAQAALSATQSLANAQLQIHRDRIENELQLELSSIDEIERRKLEAAGEDQVLQKKILAQSVAARLEAEKKAAKERRKIARTEAVVQGALAAVEALPNPFAVAAAAAATLFQLSVIDSQQFAGGGYTGSGLYKDSTGHRVAGVVHNDEWVAPKSMVEDPATAPIIQRLERIRIAKRGYAEGGFTTVSTTPPTFDNGSTSSTGEFSDPATQDLLRQMIMVMRAWPTRLKAEVVLSEFESAQSELDYIRDLSQA